MAEYRRETRITEERDPQTSAPVEPLADTPAGEPGAYRRVEREVIHDESATDRNYQRQMIYARIANVVWSVVGFIEALIGLRIVLHLIAANAGNSFVRFVYNFSGVFVNPFAGIVHNPASGNVVLEVNSIIAMLVYLLIGWAVVRIIRVIVDTTASTKA